MVFKAPKVVVWILCIVCSTTTLCRVASAFSAPNITASSFYNRPASIRLRNERLQSSVNVISDGSLPPLSTLSRRSALLRPFRDAVKKFRSNWKTYATIPFVAAAVGWATSYMAIKMIFYPIHFFGIDIYRPDGSPLGLIGWQGIVPTKSVKMSEKLVDLVLSQLLSVRELFSRLDPRRIADLLGPEIPKLTKSIASDILPKIVRVGSDAAVEGAAASEAANLGVRGRALEIVSNFNRRFLIHFVKDVQENVEDCLNIKNCVVDQMMTDRSLLGNLFQRLASKELKFLRTSGVWFGFLLGLVQMTVSLFWNNPWSISIGGLFVGFVSNWLALKMIFEPINPTKFGPLVLQGLFLKRQKEVSAEFAHLISKNLLTSEKLWNSILTDASTSANFRSIFAKHLFSFMNKVTLGLAFRQQSKTLNDISVKVVENLGSHVGVLHEYIDKTLCLETSLRVKMEGMTSLQFERVLHPIFEEDELKLVIAGAALGFGAGYVQQMFATGVLTLPTVAEAKDQFRILKERIRLMFRELLLKSKSMLEKMKRLKPEKVVSDG